METEWFNINAKAGYDNGDIPRRLTLEQINFLLDDFPSVKCDDNEARIVANKEIANFLAEQLSNEAIAPSQLESLKKKLRDKFLNARSNAGENIGVSTADALGETSTQVALNTFHVGGAATAVLVGIEGLKSLIFTYQPKNKSTIIHLNLPNKPKDFDETLAVRKDLEGVSLGNLMDMNNFEIDTFGNLGRPSWYDYWDMVYEKAEYPDETMMIRIKLKLDKLLYFNITMSELYSMIMKSSYGKFDNPIINMIYSPLHIATIDLFLLPNKISSENAGLQKFAEVGFFRNTVIPTFDSIYIRGIPSIKKLFPVSISVWEKSFSLVRHLYDDEIDQAIVSFGDAKNLWYVKLNRFLMSKSGIDLVELEELLDSLGLEFEIDVEEEYMFVNIPFEEHKDDLSKFIRERKNGLPYIKDSEIISVKENKYIKYANIRFFDHQGKKYIIYDNKYIKYLLLYLQKKGFVWSIANDIDLWRSISYNDSFPIESLGLEEPSEGSKNKIKGHLLTKYPEWLKDITTEELFKYEDHDYKRAFFLTLEDEHYIYFHRSYESEIIFHSKRGKYTLGNPVRFQTSLEIKDFSLKRKNKADKSYLKYEKDFKEKLTKLINDNGYSYGDDIPFEVLIENKTFFTLNENGNILLYPITIPDNVQNKINEKIKFSEELDDTVINNYLSKNFDKINRDDLTDLYDIITTEISSCFKQNSSAKSYDHWFLTSKDKVEKKYSIYDTLSHPAVDSARTYNNSLSEIAKIFGIEAAYSFFIKALKDLNESSGNYIDPRYILIIADFIFSRGKPNSVLFSGLSRQPIGHISLITVERAMEVLRKLAFTTSKEDINNVSVAISTGQPTPGGTGTNIFSDHPSIQREILKFNGRLNDSYINPDEISNAIKNMDNNINNNFEPEKQLPDIRPRYEIGKIYKSFNELYNDVLRETKMPDMLALSNYKQDVLSIPDFNISPMDPIGNVTNLLKNEIKLIVAEKTKEIDTKTQVLDLSNLRRDGGPRPPPPIRGPDKPRPPPPSNRSSSSSSELPKLSTLNILKAMKQEETGPTFIDMRNFEDNFDK